MEFVLDSSLFIFNLDLRSSSDLIEFDVQDDNLIEPQMIGVEASLDLPLLLLIPIVLL